MQSADKLLAGVLDIRLIHHRILQSGINALVSEELLHLLDRHPFVDRHSSKCPSELVRVCLVDAEITSYIPEADLHVADLQAVKRLDKRNKECFFIVRSACEILL